MRGCEEWCRVGGSVREKGEGERHCDCVKMADCEKEEADNLVRIYRLSQSRPTAGFDQDDFF